MKTPIPLPPKRKTPVTLIIGIKCADAVVLASDSQITYGTTKRTDGTKMEIVDFDGVPVMVAQSGSVVLSNRFVDILAELAAKTEFPTEAQICDAASQAMRQVRNEQRETHFNCTSEELSELFRRNGTECEVMLGFFTKNTPHLVSVSLHYATAQKCRSFFDAVGCGSPLGFFLLGEYAGEQMNHGVAAVLAIYVVELVKKHDAMCGGDTKVSVLFDHKTGLAAVKEYPALYIKQCAEMLLKGDSAAKPERLKSFESRVLSESFQTISKVFLPRILQ